MKSERTSVFSNSLIWFGAGVSVAEILTGTLIAPLGFEKGMVAIIIGHFIGCMLLFLAGVIGGKTKMSSMETVKLSFGTIGMYLFSFLNVIQLIGWTAVMINSGASSANSVYSVGDGTLWAVLIGVLILIWLNTGLKKLEKLNIVTMSALFVLTLILSVIVFSAEKIITTENGMSFGSAVELSVAMPLSWLPLIADYTRTAEKPVKSSLASSITYFFVSVWMYAIGMGASIFTGESDIALIMLKSGMGLAALLIVVFSTFTTTFLDVYSAGVSCRSMSEKLKTKPSANLVLIIGVLLAVFTNIGEIEGFLYFIGSVFAPMSAILLTDYFILKKDYALNKFSAKNLVIWLIGFVLYRFLMKTDMVIGYTFPAMVIISLICVICGKIKQGK